MKGLAPHHYCRLRGLLHHNGWFYLLGCVLGGRKVSDRVIRFRLDEP